METMAASRHTSAKADGSPLEFGECGSCVAASRSHRRGPRWQTEGVENLSGYGGFLDSGQNAHPRVASRAFQNIQCEHPRHQLSPRIIARARILLFWRPDHIIDDYVNLRWIFFRAGGGF